MGNIWQPRRPANAPLEAVGVKYGKTVAVGKIWRPRRAAEAPLKVVGVEDAEGVAVITIDREVEASVLEAPVAAAARGGEKGPLEDGTAVCLVDSLDGAPVNATTRQEAVGVKDAEGAAVGKIWRPRRPVKAPLEAVGVKDAKGVAVITHVGEAEPLVLGVPVVAAAGGEEKGSLEDGIVVCPMDALVGAPVIATDEKEEVSVQGDPLFPAIDQKVDAPVVEVMQAITVKGNGKEEQDKEGIKWLKHYSTAQSILIIGDGDFSFSLALATTFGSGGNLVATSLDSYGALTRKYGKAEYNVRELKRLGATVLHGVDAETMMLHPYMEMRRFDRIVFNFPHAGFKGKEYLLHVINAHKKLVHGFLANARQLLRLYGEIHLSHKTGFPYDAWDIKQLAYESCLIMVRKVGFSKEDYPGYNQKRGDGATCDESFPLGPCCTFMFSFGDVEKLKQAHGSRVGSISSCLGDSRFYPGISDMMWPFGPQPAWPQPHFPRIHMPKAFDPCPFGVAEMEVPLNCYGTSFHHQDMVQPTHQEQPWYQEGPPIEPPWTLLEHQSLQREYEIHRQQTLSLGDSKFYPGISATDMMWPFDLHPAWPQPHIFLHSNPCNARAPGGAPAPVPPPAQTVKKGKQKKKQGKDNNFGGAPATGGGQAQLHPGVAAPASFHAIHAPGVHQQGYCMPRPPSGYGAPPAGAPAGYSFVPGVHQHVHGAHEPVPLSWMMPGSYPQYDQGPLIQALANLAQQASSSSTSGPPEWVMDSGASSHMAAHPGWSDQGSAPPM